MNPIKLVTRPVKHVGEAIAAPFRAVFVIGICWFVNAATNPGHWWVKWVVLGMAIHVLVAWARAAKSLLLLAVVAFVGWQIWKRFGPAARAQFDAWVQRTNPKTAQVAEFWRSTTAGAGQPFQAH
jgi:hypothetical protein